MDAKKALTAARAAGFSVDQAKRAKKRLKVRSVKSGMAGGWDWVLDEGSTKGAKGVRVLRVLPSPPSALPSASDPDPWADFGQPGVPLPLCTLCGDPIASRNDAAEHQTSAHKVCAMFFPKETS